MFRDYDQAALELQYDVTAHYAGLEAFREAHAARRAAANAAARADRAARLDVPYGAHPREKIDFFLAAQPAAPLLVYIHGGYWRARDRSDFSFLAPSFLARGISVASVGYPLCPEVRLRRIVESCRDAIAFIAGNEATFAIDPARIHVAGHSAGGHLAAMMMATDWQARGLAADLVKTGIAISGLYDLAPLALTKINADIHLDAGEIADLSPVRLAPRHAGPLIVTSGGQETAEFGRQAGDLATAWRARDMAVVALDSPGFHHFNVVDQLGEPGTALFETVLAAIAQASRI